MRHHRPKMNQWHFYNYNELVRMPLYFSFFLSSSLAQWFSALAAHSHQLGALKNCGCLYPTHSQLLPISGQFGFRCIMGYISKGSWGLYLGQNVKWRCNTNPTSPFLPPQRAVVVAVVLMRDASRR